MRRALALLVVPLCAAGLLAASGCGVTADDTAAVVGTQTVSTSDVDELAGDAAFVGAALQGAVPPTNDSVLPGDLARNALAFEVQRAALRDAVDRWGLQVTPGDRSAARAGIQQQVPGLKKRNLDRVVGYVTAESALEARLGRLDPKNSKDLRTMYDATPALWDQVCLTAVAVPSAAATLSKAQRALDGGATLAELPKRVKDAQVAADPSQGCAARSQLPREIRDDIAVASVKELRGPVVVTGSNGGVAYFYRVESVERLTFDAARKKELPSLAQGLAQQAQQQKATKAWFTLVLQAGVQINPRYGSELAVTAQGVQVLPPESPATTLPAVRLPGAAGGTQQQGPQQQGTQQQGPQ